MPPKFDHLLVDIECGVATITLNRPTLHNAFNATLVIEVTRAMQLVGAAEGVRVVVLAGAGRSFCAGADLGWMRTQAGYTEEESFEETLLMARMYESVDRCRRPVIARVHGAAIGGGVGLVAAADIAIAASDRARFGLSEIRLGLIPAVISPYVVAKCGVGVSRELMLSGERFGAAKARAIGLVNHVVPDERLDEAVQERIDVLRTGAPEAQSACKELIRAVAGRRPDQVMEDTARRIAERRVSDEGREGIGAFLEKREPSWVKG